METKAEATLAKTGTAISANASTQHEQLAILLARETVWTGTEFYSPSRFLRIVLNRIPNESIPEDRPEVSRCLDLANSMADTRHESLLEAAGEELQKSIGTVAALVHHSRDEGHFRELGGAGAVNTHLGCIRRGLEGIFR